MRTTLPTDSNERKDYPLVSGCLNYFPAALAGVAKLSLEGNRKHNPDEELHHARDKSTDHADCLVRHLIDLQGLLKIHSSTVTVSRNEPASVSLGTHILREASAVAWRALALSQELHESLAGSPLAPGARYEKRPQRAYVTDRNDKVAAGSPDDLSSTRVDRQAVGDPYGFDRHVFSGEAGYWLGHSDDS